MFIIISIIGMQIGFAEPLSQGAWIQAQVATASAVNADKNKTALERATAQVTQTIKDLTTAKKMQL